MNWFEGLVVIPSYLYKHKTSGWNPNSRKSKANRAKGRAKAAATRKRNVKGGAGYRFLHP